MVRIHLGQPILGDPDLVGVAARRGRSSIGRAPALQAGSCGFKSRRLHHLHCVNVATMTSLAEREEDRTRHRAFEPQRSRWMSTCSLTSRVGGTRSSRISSENQIKLERVYVRMPRHQEPTKDVAKLRNAPERRKQSLTRGCPRFGNDTV